MGIKIQDLDEAIDENGAKILVHGLSGSGKTVFCVTGSIDSDLTTIILSAERGLLSLKKLRKEYPDLKEKVKVIRIDSYEDLCEVLEHLQEKKQMADILCLDSISEIASQILADAKEQHKDARQAYGQLIDNTLDRIRDFRDLDGYNVVLTSKMKREEDSDTGRVRYAPAFAGKALGPEVPYLVDEVFALRVEEDEDGEKYRIMQTDLDAHYYAKDRSGNLDEFEKPNLKKILKKLNPDYVSLVKKKASKKNKKSK